MLQMTTVLCDPTPDIVRPDLRHCFVGVMQLLRGIDVGGYIDLRFAGRTTMKTNLRGFETGRS